MQRMPYRRDNVAPPAGPRMKLVRLKAKEVFNVGVVGTVFHGFWTHWGSRTEPCTEPKADCQGCQRQWPTRWKCYLHVIREDTGEEGFLECTALVRDKVLSHVGNVSYLRGSRLKLQRGNGDKTSLHVMLLRPWLQEHPGAELPAEKDPEETLHALFSFRRSKPA